MKTSIITSVAFAAALSAPLAANAGEGAPQGRHLAHRHMVFAHATALYAPAPRSLDAPQFDRPYAGAFEGDTGFSWEPKNW
jgi:hypothetical protein